MTLSTVAESGNFGTGTIDGQVTQFVIVPEPGLLAAAGVAILPLGLIRRRSLRRG